jgi:uncharacterized protein
VISIREQVTIPSPPRTVWPMLRDPALVVSCIPGASLTAADQDGTYQGAMRVKFGPTIAIFRGQAKLAYDDTIRSCTIEGRGIDGRGASRALASGVVTALGDTATVLKVEGSFNVAGPLETFANAGGVHLARAILAEFAGNMARLAAERTAAEPEMGPELDGDFAPHSPADAGPSLSPGGGERVGVRGPATAVAASAPLPLQGGGLLWRAFVGWLKKLFLPKGKAG